MKRFLAAAVAALALVVGSNLLASSQQDNEPNSTVLFVPQSGDRVAELDRLIGVFEARVADSDDALNQWTLGAHYLDRATVTGDLADYHSAKAVLETAHMTNAGNPAVDVPLASARLALHDFSGATTLLESHLLDPGALAIYGDAKLGLGDLGAARVSYDRLGRTAPEDPAVTVRLASLSLAEGNRDAAIEIAGTAAAQAEDLGLTGEALSFYMTYQGQLMFEGGRFADARPVLERAVALDDAYLSPKIELAHVLAATGDLEAGIDLLEEVLSHGPDADAAVVLGDFLTRAGDLEGAADAYSLLDDAVAEAPEAFRRDLSLFLSNQDVDAARAVALAREDLATRQDSGAYDTLAWALYRDGDLELAREASDRAIGAGTSNASAYFHAGMISLGLGEETRGIGEIEKALEMNPFFHAVLSLDAQEIVGRS